MGFLRFVHKRLGNAVSPSGLWPFSAVSRNAFRPEEPRNGPESRFFFKDPIFIWEKGTLGALSLPGASLLLGEVQEVNAAFGPPGARKTAETARFGRATGKIELTAASAPKFRSSDPLESSGLMKKRPRYGPFFGENQFSPADEAVLMRLVKICLPIKVSTTSVCDRHPDPKIGPYIPGSDKKFL